MDDLDFFDEIYQLWSKTTGASDMFWMPEEDTDEHVPWLIYAVNENQDRTFVGSVASEADADFITGIHGCLADLIRKLGEAQDEADRLDYGRDEQECRIAELEIEVAGKNDELHDCHTTISGLHERISELEAKLSDERGYSSYLQCDINDLTAELSACLVVEPWHGKVGDSE